MVRETQKQKDAKALLLKRSALAFAKTILHNPEDPTKLFEPRWNQTPILEMPLSESRLNTVRAQRGCGKLLDIHTKIPTPTGWTTMGELAIGDMVFDEHGMPCMVTFVSFIEEDHESYLITFDDGTSIVAGPEHQWFVHAFDRITGDKQSGVVTTADMLGDANIQYSIDVAKPLKLPDADLPIDPYEFGTQLGTLRFRIPLAYQRASIPQRTELLMGLMDSAGRVNDIGRCNYETDDAGLACDISILLYGLGIKVRKRTYDQYTDLRFTPSIPVFKDANKRAKQYDGGWRPYSLKYRYITSIEKTESRSLCCIGVNSPNHLYLAGEECIVTHNTEGIVAWLMWYAWTRAGRQILILGPSELVVQRVFEKINLQISNSDFLAGAVKVNRKKPFEIHLTNGSLIRGLSTGVASKKGAQNVRGEHPHVIYIDEADYLGDEDWDAFTSLFDPPDKKTPKPIVWATTTPTGKRSRFYFLCEDKGINGKGHDWKDWWFAARHFPDVTFEGPHTRDHNGWYFPAAGSTIKCTAVNPDWDKESDDRQRRANGEQTYFHEILAWWGDSTYAVWPKKLIESAINRGKGFSYLSQRVQPNQRFSAGCDIDESQAMPNFCAIEYVPHPDTRDGSGGKFIVRLREEMERPSSGKINQDLKNNVARIDRDFRPDRFYIDRGYGGLIVEEISELGIRSVQGKWFRENVELIDPETGEVVKKPLKHVMIALATRLFEEGRIVLPPRSQKSIEYDVFGNMREIDEPDYDESFVTDLMNYQVTKVLKSGTPEYTSQNEHSIDAFLLALLAAVQSFDKFYTDFSIPSEAAVIPSGESAILGGQLDSTPRPPRVRRPVDNGENRSEAMSIDQFLGRAERRRVPQQRSFAGTERSTF